MKTAPDTDEDARSAAELLRFPGEPYPGLRPFLDFESALLFGRDKQIQEVIGHLERHQFVAVIGGSGSGKSSLVRAGVVPALRSYSIRGAGDFWIPMVCTPGTNAADRGGNWVQNSPLMRFAWKFSRLLNPLEHKEANVERVGQIAEMLRDDGGIAAIIDTYSSQIQPRFGLAGSDARFLFVVDQFEELFHPTNRDGSGQMMADGQMLVERIIDHFFTPHQRCYLVLTMRSEHLNDCAGFLQLPDAINRASYLVRRLDDAQLAEAIVEPARSYLRVRQREEREADRLPPEIIFHADVMQRLLGDVMSIAHDPDHLPLLQHVLSRTWDVALQRPAEHTLPACIDMDDLAAAVLADPRAKASSLDGKENVLRICLERHADAIFNRHTERQRLELIEMLKLLAVKDPNTGMYTQQRINIDAGNSEHYRSMVKDGFIGQVNYLFWDKENKDNITLKVSHESFIRGWSVFRDLITREAERFEEFIQVLRACDTWHKQGMPDALLLEGAQLRNLRQAHLEADIKDQEAIERWFRLLAFLRDGRGFSGLKEQIREFVDRSDQRDLKLQEDREAEERRQRDRDIDAATAQADAAAKRAEAAKARSERDLVVTQAKAQADKQKSDNDLMVAQAQADADRVKSETALKVARAQADTDKAQYDKRVAQTKARWGWGLGIPVFIGLVLTSLGLAVYVPVNKRVAELFAAQSAIRQVNFADRGVSSEIAASHARNGQTALAALSRGLAGSDSTFDLKPPMLVDQVGTWPGIKSQTRLLSLMASNVDAEVNGALRQLLTAYPWPVKPAGPAASAAVGRYTKCWLDRVEGLAPSVPSGPGSSRAPKAGMQASKKARPVDSWVYEAESVPNSADAKRVLVVTQSPQSKDSWDLRPAMLVDSAEGTICVATQSIWRSPPPETAPRLVLDSQLRYLMQLTKPPGGGGGPSVTIDELQWLPGGNGQQWVVGRLRPLPPVVVQDKTAVKALQDAMAGIPQPHAVLPSEPYPGGLVVRPSTSSGWRFLTTLPSIVPADGFKLFTQKPLEATSDPACRALDLSEETKPGPNEEPGLATRFDRGSHCLAVIRFTPGLGHGYVPDQQEQVRLVAFHKATAASPHPQRIASVNFGFQRKSSKSFYVGVTGAYDGWIALDTSLKQNASELHGVPWSTAAIAALVGEVAKQPGAMKKSASEQLKK